MSNNRHKYRIPFFDNIGKFIGFEDLDILKGVQPYNAGVSHRGEPEQCTGLKDKNKKLIYDGDVVKQVFKDGSSMHKEVYYDSVMCRWYLRYCSPGLHSTRQYLFWDFNSSIADKIEIIGNIHEDQFRDGTKMVEAKPCQG